MLDLSLIITFLYKVGDWLVALYNKCVTQKTETIKCEVIKESISEHSIPEIHISVHYVKSHIVIIFTNKSKYGVDFRNFKIISGNWFVYMEDFYIGGTYHPMNIGTFPYEEKRFIDTMSDISGIFKFSVDINYKGTKKRKKIELNKEMFTQDSIVISEDFYTTDKECKELFSKKFE